MFSWIAVETVSILFNIFVNVIECNWKVIVNKTHFWEVIKNKWIILWMKWLMMAYLQSDLWIEMKYRLIKMFIVLLKISD
jgi:hypothetical protein